MKHSIGVKMIAILLCAAALFGVVVSGAGIIGLTSMGLYSKTVEQLREEELQNCAEWLVTNESRRYYSGTLGGCPDEMLDQFYDDNYGHILNFDHVGYTLKDSEGRVIAGYGSLTAENAQKVYTFTPSGKYVHLVSAIPASRKEAEQIAASNPEGKTYTTADGGYYYVAVPEEGIAVYQATFQGDNGTTQFSSGNGIAYWNRDGALIFQWLTDYYGEEPEQVYTVELKGEGDETVFFATNPNGVGEIFSTASNNLAFRVALAKAPDPALEQVPDTTEATTAPTEAVTEPVTEPETQPETEATEEGGEGDPDEENNDAGVHSEETEDPSSASAMPEEGEGGEPEEMPESMPAETAPIQTLPPETTVPQTLPPETTVPPETVPEATAPVLINGKPLTEFEINRSTYFDHDSNEDIWIEYVYAAMPEITAEVYTEAGALRNEERYTFLAMIQPYRNELFLVLGASVLVFAALAVYLCCAAGRKPKEDAVHAQGLNRLPLDVYLGITAVGCTGLAILVMEGGDYLLRKDMAVACAAGAGGVYTACLLVVGFLFAAVAQCKTPGGYWWRNLLTMRLLVLAVAIIKWCWTLFVKRILPWLVRLVKKLWHWLVRVVKGVLGWIGRVVNRLLTILPLIWQWLLAGGLLVLLLLIGFASRSEGLLVLCIVADIAIVLYGARSFGTLMDAAKRMSKGNLNVKVEDKTLVGAFKEFAGDLNALADVAVVAAKKQLKSERMKTELITNVSHDIKTPLTSIINYVDLLQRPHTPEEEKQYLEVLDRQSQRLKKLIEDLMEMSKASTGNMTVDLEVVDAVESVNQALGEFSEKLEKAQLIPVFRHAEETVPMMADGRLAWRVLSNLLSNAVKYAMPGTRLYIDLMRLDGQVSISLKNISRDQLNVPADELMERFVRGDDSRNTEGSGLGLNIAKSLMELQKGQLELLVDGDLFKVTLLFPAE